MAVAPGSTSSVNSFSGRRPFWWEGWSTHAVYRPALYLDEFGEEDPGLHRGRRLVLCAARYRALQTLWRNHEIATNCGMALA